MTEQAKKSYRDVRKEMTASGPSGGSCHVCGTTTIGGSLSDFGARCFPCYQAYLRESRVFPDVGKKSDDPRAWAYALQRRHESGDRLTPAQVSAYKAVI
jgi:hypothetical protein